MTPLQQYGLLFLSVVSTVGFVVILHPIVRSLRRTKEAPGKDIPFTGGTLQGDPVWVRYHARYYGLALLFLGILYGWRRRDHSPLNHLRQRSQHQPVAGFRSSFCSAPWGSLSL